MYWYIAARDAPTRPIAVKYRRFVAIPLKTTAYPREAQPVLVIAA
jgi:hypothetical protein